MGAAAPTEVASESAVRESADRAVKSEDGKTIGNKPAPPTAPGRPFAQAAPGNVPNQTRLVRPPASPRQQGLGGSSTDDPTSVLAGRGTNGDGRVSRGAVMSLALQIKPPEGTVRRHFHFLGSRGPQQRPDLDIVYQDLESQSTARGFFVVLVLIGCWFFRQRPVSERLVLVIAWVARARLSTVTSCPHDTGPIAVLPCTECGRRCVPDQRCFQ